jgi:hypothetical protein
LIFAILFFLLFALKSVLEQRQPPHHRRHHKFFMVIIIALLSLSVALAIFAGVLWNSRAAGWVLLASGIILLGHAGITMYRIHANNGVTDSGSFYGLFVTIPAGILLLLIGGLTLCVSKWMARRAAVGNAVPKVPGLWRFGRTGFLLGWAAGFFAAIAATYFRVWEMMGISGDFEIGEHGFPPFVWLPLLAGIAGLALGLIAFQRKRRNA